MNKQQMIDVAMHHYEMADELAGSEATNALLSGLFMLLLAMVDDGEGATNE
jgi:hypothetical protein